MGKDHILTCSFVYGTWLQTGEGDVPLELRAGGLLSHSKTVRLQRKLLAVGDLICMAASSHAWQTISHLQSMSRVLLRDMISLRTRQVCILRNRIGRACLAGARMKCW